MATPQEELAELNRQIADLKRQAGDVSEFIPLQNLKDAQRLFTSLKNEVSEIGDGLSYVYKAFRDSVAELSKQNTELNATRSALKSISNISQKILVTRSLEGDISTKELASLEKKALLQFKSLDLAVKSGRVLGEALTEAKDALAQQNKFFKALQGIRKEQEEINKNSGVRLFTGLEDITNAIPGLNKFTGAFKEASTAAKEQARFNKAAFGTVQGITRSQANQNKHAQAVSDQIKSQLPHLQDANNLTQEKIKKLGLEKILIDKNKKSLAGTAAIAKANSLILKKSLPTVSSITPFTAGLKALGPIIKSALAPFTILLTVLKTLTKVDTLTGNLAKNLGVSYEESLGLVSSLTDIANRSGDAFVTTEGLLKAQTQLSTALGTNVQLNSQLLIDYTKLTEQAGYSVEAATQLGILSKATGVDAKDITTQFLGQAKALNLSNNLALNEKQLVESISKVSKGTLATFAKKPQELMNAVYAAKKLGLEISQVEKIADGLLEIESSLTAEFEAEVITGRQLNLERARYFALTNDIKGVADELGKQQITQVSFANSSRIEQQAVAAAMGMSADELGKMLITQQALSNVNAKDEKALKEQYEAVKGTAQEKEFLNKLGNEEYAQQLKSQSVQDRFNQTVAKLQDIFVALAEPVLAIISPFADLVNNIMPSINMLLSPLLKGLNAISGVAATILKVFGGIYLVQKSINVASLIAQGIQSRRLLAKELELGLGGSILAVLGLENAAIEYKLQRQKQGNIFSAIGVALEQTKLGAIIASGYGMVKNLAIGAAKLAQDTAIAAANLLNVSATTVGIGTAIALAAAAGGIAYLHSVTKKAGDVMSPADGKTRISTKEGGLFELSKNDDVIAAPNLLGNRGGERNFQPSGATNVTVSLSKGDIMAIANAVREGASQAKINVNLDGNAVANNLQTPMAMNTRTISV